MDKISGNLIQLSDQLDQADQQKCANVIDNLLESRSLHKVAQYVGVIGYVLKQNRAMGNCVRKKRVASQGSMQEVVMECLSEYQDGQSYGTNDWTSKYAEVIQQAPTKFASTHVDFLDAVAESNDISTHIHNVKEAQAVLLKHDVQDTFITEVLANLDGLEQGLKGGDAAHRPFKVAAPPSDRSRWSRFWSPSWTRRGKDKDAQYEMDNVLESVMNVSSNAQQIRSNISRLRHVARELDNKNLIENINALSTSDWNKTNARIQNIGKILSALRDQNPDNPSVLQPAEILSDLSSNVKNVHDQISRVQRNMYNLRLRDAVKGRGDAASATNEYVDLDQALSRLYANPLDEKSLYYSQKLHGRLEDALNMRQTDEPSGYNDWADMPISEPQEVPGVNPNAQPDLDPTAAPVNQSTENIPQSIANEIRQIADPVAVERFVGLLRQVLTTDITPESREAFNMVADALEEQTSAQPTPTPTPAPAPVAEPVQSPENPIDPYSPGSYVWGNPESQGTTASNLKTLRKMADALEPIGSELVELLSEYLQDAEDELPEFPETCSILKEEAASWLKLTQKKGGEVAVNT